VVVGQVVDKGKHHVEHHQCDIGHQRLPQADVQPPGDQRHQHHHQTALEEQCVQHPHAHALVHRTGQPLQYPVKAQVVDIVPDRRNGCRGGAQRTDLEGIKAEEDGTDGYQDEQRRHLEQHQVANAILRRAHRS